MADAVSAGTLAAVDQCYSPSARIIPSISDAAEEDAVVGLFVLGSVSFFFSNTVTSVETILFGCGSCGGTSIGIGVCRLGILSSCPRPGLLLCASGSSELRKRTDSCRILLER